MRFKKDLDIAIVSRLWYTTDSWYKKSDYSPTWKSYRWSLKPLTIKQLVDVSNFGKEHQFNTQDNADIKESDKLIISWVEYNVKWVSIFKWVTFSRLMCILQKW